MKTVIYHKTEAEFKAMRKYLVGKGSTFVASNIPKIAKSPAEAAAIAKYCKATSQGRFRRTAAEKKANVPVVKAIENRLAEMAKA